MDRQAGKIPELIRDSTGQTSIEWALLLLGFGLPMVYIFAMLLSILAEHYRMTSFIETLPFP